MPREIYSAIEDQVGAMAKLYAGSDRENHPSHKKYASNAALKAQKPVKSLTRILSVLKIAPITPVKNQSATTAVLSSKA